MPITINGTGSISGVTAGGLPSGSVTSATIADANITATKLDGAQSGSAPIYGCRAWVNFDGTRDTTGATSTANTDRLIRASGNVTSVLRNGTGSYTVTFTTAMPDANYTAVGHASTETDVGNTNPAGVVDRTTTTCRVDVETSAGAQFDTTLIDVVIFR